MARPRGQAASDSWRRAHIHLLNTKDLADYALRPAMLRERLQDLVGSERLDVTITESDDPERITPDMHEANVLVGYTLPHRRVAEMGKLRWIHLISAGVDHLLPLDWVPAGMIVTNSSGVHADLAGEYAACALLMLNIGMPRHVMNQRARRWDQTFNSPVRGKTVVVVGVGAIGGSAATQAKRLGLRVLGVRWSGRSHRSVEEMYRPDDLLRILPRADFLLVTAPLTPETRGLIGARELDALRPDAGVINMARAALVDYRALSGKLARRELRAAILDVFDPEPLPHDSPLWDLPGLLITPHISSDPVDYADRLAGIVVDNLRRLVKNQGLRNRVNPERGY